MGAMVCRSMGLVSVALVALLHVSAARAVDPPDVEAPETDSLETSAPGVNPLDVESPETDAANVDPAARVRLVLPACTLSSIDVAAYAAIVRVELAGDGRLTDVCWPHQPCEGDGAGYVVRLEYLRCNVDVRSAVLSVQHVGTGRVEAHTIRLDDVEERTRPRNLALAAVELFRRVHVALSHPEVPREPEESPPQVALGMPPRGAPAADAPRLPSARWQTDAALALRLTPNLDAALMGPSLSAALRLFDLPLRARLSAALLFGTASDSLGEIDVRSLSGTLDLRVIARVDALEFELGPYLEIGWLHGAASSHDPAVRATSADDLFVAMGLSLSAAPRLVGPLRAMGTVAIGYGVRGAVFGSDGGAQVCVAGPLVDVLLGAAIDL